MAKIYSWKFWAVFWTVAAIFLAGWSWFWLLRSNAVDKLSPALDMLPIDTQRKEDYGAAVKLAEYLLAKDDKEKTFLVLFQNNMEIRPGGGFIGAFGILKMRGGHVVSMESHDLSNFDARIPDMVEPPYPMKETLRVKSWKLRDSNYSPDFEINAAKAEEFYRMGKGEENFDAVIGITANVLESMLEVVGPIELEGYPGTYDSENAVLALEYQVEKAFDEQGIERGDRKEIMGEFAREILKRAQSLGFRDKIKLANILLDDMHSKDIQIFFKDGELQEVVRQAGWSGSVDQQWQKDYLMAVDANLGAYKSDYYMQRSLDYTIDLSKNAPAAKLKITYTHTAKQRDWMTKEYLSYLRVYVPEGSWLTDSVNFDDARFGSELGKKYFGAIVKVPLDSTKIVELNYTLPEEISTNYDLLIQKQAGLSDIPVSVHIIAKDGTKTDYGYNMDTDVNLAELSGKNS